MISSVVLAAGKSERMGFDKALLKYKGSKFLDIILSKIRVLKLRPSIVVAGRHNFKVITENCELSNSEVIINENAGLGQVSSVKLAVSALLKTKSETFLLSLVDQPLIETGTYEKIISFWKKNKASIIIPKCAREAEDGSRGKTCPLYKRGHPVIIPRLYWRLILDAPFEKGLHWVTHHEKVRVKDLIVKDKGILRDFDTPEDYRGLPPVSW